MFLALQIISVFSSLVMADPIANVDRQGVALQGYDAVSYFEPSGPVQGDARFTARIGEVTYRFANEEHRRQFQSHPEKYEPQFGGWCAFAVADSSSKVSIDPKSFVIQDGRLLLFYKGLWGDTRAKWLHGSERDPAAFLKLADHNWPSTKAK